MLQIYSYDIPHHLLQPWSTSCAPDMYYMEFLWPELLKQSPFHTTNADTAVFYLIPQFSTCYYHKCVFEDNLSTDLCKNNTAAYLTAILDHVQLQPYWGMEEGADHVFVFTWDQGSEVLGWRSDVRKRIETAIQLTTVGAVRRYENFDPHKDIVIPPFANLTNAFKVLNAWSGVTLSDVYELFQGVKEILISPGVSMTGKLSMWLSKLSKKLMKLISTQHTRGIFAYFRGTIIPDFRYSHGVRQYLKELGNLYPTRYWIREGHSPYYWHELRNATFSLCPSGWSSWSPRLFDSIVAGAIPVIFADGIALPFEREVDYRKVAVKIGNSDVAKVDEVLRNVTEREVRKKQMVMGRIRHHFVWNSPPKSGDAFYMTIEELKRKKKFRAVGFAAFY